MGQFRVTVTAVGNHGCGRERKDDQTLEPCNSEYCTDCITRNYIAALRKVGTSVEDAIIQHWPGTPHEVVDNLVTNYRKGSF